MPTVPAFELLLQGAAESDGEALAASVEHPGSDAFAALRRAAAAHPEDPDYWFILGTAHARRGEHEAAAQAFREALRFPTAEPAYRRSLGESLWRLGRFDEAREAFDQTLRDHPGDEEAANGLALSLLRLERPAEAVAALRAVAARRRDRADWRSNLGASLWAAGETAQAERCFRGALRSRPREALFHRNLGLALLARGRAAGAAACFREALRLAPGSAATVMDLGDALFAAGRHAEAEGSYERALALDPGAAAQRPATQAAWQAIRVERARGELRARAEPTLASRAISWGFDLAHRLEGWLDLLGNPGRRLANLGLLLLIVVCGRVVLVVLPHYVAHHRLEDEVVRLSRMPTRDDDLVRRGVLEAVRRLEREPYVLPDAVRVEGTAGTRSVRFSYEVEVAIVPGLATRLRFRIRVEEPFFAEPAPVVF